MEQLFQSIINLIVETSDCNCYHHKCSRCRALEDVYKEMVKAFPPEIHPKCLTELPPP